MARRNRSFGRPPRVTMNVQNGDLHLSFLKITSISTSATVILGDAECIAPRAVSFTRGVMAETAFAPPVVSPGPGGAGGARA